MNTPVALLIFNRPDCTERVLAQVAKARPSKLLVIADGPRPDRSRDMELCAATRALIDRVDWRCEVLKNYSDVNLGVGTRPATGLQWVFEQVEEAIILEDDCVPDPTFFPYCEELLDRYRQDERVMHVSGDNWNFNEQPPSFSYFFSLYCYSCGWATWRRAFRHYDPDMKAWSELRTTGWLIDVLGDAEAAAFWSSLFDNVCKDGVATHGWDWPWLFACLLHRGISILPATNLISNIGFGEDATHTQSTDDERAFVPTRPMTFPLRHPPHMIRDFEADRRIAEQVGVRRQPHTMYRTLRQKCLAAIPSPIRATLSSTKITLWS